jgi:phage gp29-like protein
MFEDILKETQAIHEQKYQDAQKQLEDLYAHLNDRMTFDIFEKTFSNIKFDDFLTNANSQK